MFKAKKTKNKIDDIKQIENIIKVNDDKEKKEVVILSKEQKTNQKQIDIAKEKYKKFINPNANLDVGQNSKTKEYKVGVVMSNKYFICIDGSGVIDLKNDLEVPKNTEFGGFIYITLKFESNITIHMGLHRLIAMAMLEVPDTLKSYKIEDLSILTADTNKANCELSNLVGIVNSNKIGYKNSKSGYGKYYRFQQKK